MLLATIILLIIYLCVNHNENKRREINRKYNPIGAFDKAQKIYDDAFLLMRVEVLRLRNEKNWISNGMKPIAKSWLIERKCGLRSLTIRSNII